MELNLLNTYEMQAIVEEIVPEQSFFKDRYFPTAPEDIFAADKVLVEYQKGDRMMAAFVAQRVGDIPVDRRGYEVHEFEPPYVAPSRVLTIDDLRKRGFGEALFAGSTQAQRAARIQLQDFTDLNNRIGRREEWMCVQTMLENACDIQEYIDARIEGAKYRIQFFDGSSDHLYTVANPWDGTNGKFFDDVNAMCKQLSKRGLPSADLLLGSRTARAIKRIPEVVQLLDNRRMIFGQIDPSLGNQHGIAFLGQLNFDGFILNLIEVSQTFVDIDGVEKASFPENAAMVTAPNCGALKYGQITQIDYGSSEFSTYAAMRVPKLVVDQDKDIRKLRLGTRPLAVPRSYCPWIIAQGVVA